jgi:hypothetical protein
MTYAQYIKKFIGKSGWLSQNPHGWFEFTLSTRSDKGQTQEVEHRGRMFEAEHIIIDAQDDFIIITNKAISTRLIPLSLFVLQYVE